MSQSEAVEGKVREIRRKTRRKYSAEEEIRIVLEGLRARRVSPSLSAGRGSPPICTTAGARSFWRPASGA